MKGYQYAYKDKVGRTSSFSAVIKSVTRKYVLLVHVRELSDKNPAHFDHVWVKWDTFKAHYAPGRIPLNQSVQFTATFSFYMRYVWIDGALYQEDRIGLKDVRSLTP